MLTEDLKGVATPLKPQTFTPVIIDPEAINLLVVCRKRRNDCIIHIDLTKAGFSLNADDIEKLRAVSQYGKGRMNRIASTYCRLEFPAKLREELEPIVNFIVAGAEKRERSI